MSLKTIQQISLAHFTILLCIPAILISPQTSAEEEAVDTGIEVEEAEKLFEASINEVSESLIEALDKAITKEIKRGDVRLAEVVERQKDNFINHDLVPFAPHVKNESQRYFKKVDEEGDKLIAVYEKARVAYAEAGDLEAAKKIQQKIHWLRPQEAYEVHNYRGHYYALVQSRANFETALTYCEKIGGNIACPNSALEDRFLYKLADKHIDPDTFGNGSTGPLIMLGFRPFDNQETNGGWYALDGSAIKYDNWHRNQPSSTEKHCFAALWSDGKWVAWTSGRPYRNSKGFIIEWKDVFTRRTTLSGLLADLDFDNEGKPKLQVD